MRLPERPWDMGIVLRRAGEPQDFQTQEKILVGGVLCTATSPARHPPLASAVSLSY